ncbi:MULTISPECIES: type IV pilin protein [Shewanella]|jgi:type IV pilus assembly protein PilE|uniref:Prepilin-type N-terminal cleavage/methylation domain-containing protein n=2 Tax=Shewanella TaxID=22 RepID=A0A6G7LUH7_9GAMM|nr:MULTISPECIES: type IV pilin protein [Shewanella]MBZ4680299.1 prepilin-type N-terminal cleavage/methylation protein [Shewanella sp.]MCA0949361.1 type IV pilin protein [Shewanella chilikensis]MCE9853129.1 type IV pilin protein [Shewanella chilikensis]MCL1161914.1 type IV pilin protein [Shewanella chilikensis]MDX6014903.1 type IV pilin protein [Shewanella indica]
MKRPAGFTLIEVMITVVIIGILASIAYPSYVQYIAKSTRSEAHAALMRLANLQEQYYLDNRTYATDMTKLGLNASPFITENGHYSIASTGTADFTLTATAQGAQASRDSKCKTLTLTDAGIKSGASTECWK